MNVVVKTSNDSVPVTSAEELTAVLTEVLTDKEKSAVLARDIMQVAATRPEGLPPLIINLSSKED